MIPRSSLLAFALATTTPFTAAAAEPAEGTVWAPGVSTTVHPSKTLGVSVGLGVGAQAAGFGGQVAVEVPAGAGWVVAPWVGVGRIPRGLMQMETMVNGGVMGKYGTDLRLVLDASFIHFEDERSSSWSLDGGSVSTTTRRFWAVGQVGGEVMTPPGLFFRVLAGGTAGPSRSGLAGAPIGSVLVGFKMF